MKNLYKYLIPAAATLAALVSCQRENPINDTLPENAVTIRVHATADDLKGIDPDGKTYIADYQGQANTILWGTGEYMKLALTAGETTTFANSTDASADTFNGDPEAMFEFSVTPGEASEYVYQGLYPASAAATNSNTNAANYKVNLPTVQNATASSYDPAAYIMVVKPETFTSVQTDWEASFRRGTALNKITLKNLPSGVSIKRVKITAEGKKLAGGRHFNLTTGEGSDVYGVESTIEVKYATALTGTNVDVWFTSWDAEIAVGEKLTVVAYTTDNKSYTKEITVPADRAIKFQEGYLNKTGVSMSGISPEDVTELIEDNYVVLAKDGDNYYALKAEKEVGKQRLLSVPYTGSLVSYLGDADLIWNVTKSGDSFIFENDGKYLGYKGSSNESYWLEAGESWTETNYLLDVTPQETAGQYYVTVHSNSTRHLSKNAADPFFAFYGNTGQKADIIFVPATVDSRTPVTLSFAEDAINKTTANYSEFTGQTATASPSVSGITYAIDGDNIGTITAATGAVVLNGNIGTATVTATFAGDATYRPASASYTINVSSASGPQYNLVTAVADVVEGDYIITWNNTYYLPSGSTSDTNPSVGTGIIVSGDKITNTVSSDMVWHFSGNNTNGFTISDGTNILHSTNAAQGISINTNSTRKWTVSIDNTYGMLLHGNDGGTRNLAVYNNGSWRYYATGSNYTGILRLYKLNESSVTPTVATPTLSIAGSEVSIACTTDGATIYYTVDGSAPSTSSSVYSTAVSIAGSQQKTIKAFATKSGYDASEVAEETYYAINVNATTNGTVTAIPFATEGAEVSLTITPDSGYALDQLSVVDGSDNAVTVTNKKFAMPSSPVTVSATFALIPVTTIATILADNNITAINTVNYGVSGVTVMAAQGKNYVIGDATGVMLMYYNGSTTLTVGNQYDVDGGVKSYNGVHEFNNPAVTPGTGTAPAYGTPETMTVSSLTSYASSPVTKYAIVSLTAPASGYVGSDGTNDIQVYDGTGTWASYYGKSVFVTGYLIGYYNSKIYFIATAIEEDSTTPTLNVSTSALNWAAAETDSKTVTVTLNGAASGYSVSPTSDANWNIADNGSGTITVSPKAANTSTTAAKTLTLTITHNDSGSLSEQVTCTQAKKTASTGGTMSIDFEGAASTYSDWTFTNIQTQKTNSSVPAKEGSYFGTTTNDSGNAATASSIVTKAPIANPASLVFYITKQTTNTNASSVWKVSISSNGSSWTQVGGDQAAANGVTRGTWIEVSRDLSSYSNVYVKIEYSGSNAIRCIDKVELTYN